MAWIERCAEFLPRDDYARIPPRQHGIYVLFNRGRQDGTPWSTLVSRAA